MKDKINFKSVIIISAISIFIIIVVNIYWPQNIIVDTTGFQRLMSRMASNHSIAPQRLYINCWRTVRNEYADKTMNMQDWSRWRNRYLKQIKTIDDAEVAINTMLASLNDKYSRFLITDSYIQEKEILDSKITGIGLIFNQVGENLIVEYVLENSPAERNGIFQGDEIISINGYKASEISVDKYLLSNEIKRNKYITIVLKRNDEIIEKRIKKAEIRLKTMKYDISDDNIGIINVATIMGEKAILDFLDIINATNDTKGIIIDLRNNYGGIVSNAIEMANYMLDDEQIVTISGKNSRLEIYASKENIFKKKPIVIMVNKNTASAAEILAGTLKDNLDAVIIGENTYGKNAVQQVIPMSNNTGLIITSYKYILPKGEDIYKVGITPDVIETDNKKMLSNAKKIINGIVEKSK